MYVGSYVMEDIQIACSRGAGEASPPACYTEGYLGGVLSCLCWVISTQVVYFDLSIQVAKGRET